MDKKTFIQEFILKQFTWGSEIESMIKEAERNWQALTDAGYGDNVMLIDVKVIEKSLHEIVNAGFFVVEQGCNETVTKPLQNRNQTVTPETETETETETEVDCANRATKKTQPPTPGLNQQAWEMWFDYRKKIKKPLKPVSIPAAQKKLAAFGDDQMAVVEQSIAEGYQGLFPLKNINSNGGNNGAHNQTRKLSVSERATAARKKYEAMLSHDVNESMGENDAHLRPPLDE